jgi:predicted dehydrogenase
MRHLLFIVGICMIIVSCSTSKKNDSLAAGDDGRVKLITLDPGHFHAALIQKKSYPQVDSNVYVYAPKGDDLNEHLKKIESYNHQTTNPTHWNEIVYDGTDFFEKMLAEKKGNVVVLAGNNEKKTEYIKKSLEAGFNVLADKPMAINSENFSLLEKCFAIAKQKGTILYDIMTERNEITTILQRELSMIPDVYGSQEKGSPEDPAIVKESVHHFFKIVSGNPLKRPAWFFDVNQEGEGIVDVTTHLVDLVQWEAFPEIAIDYRKDIQLIDASHWTTAISLSEFKQVTGMTGFPDFLLKDVAGDSLRVYCNGDILYKLKGVCAKVSVTWKYTFPKGGGDTHFSVMKGSKCNLIIRQGKEQNYQPELYVESVKKQDLAVFEKTLNASLTQLASKYPGISLQKQSKNVWQVMIPTKYRVGHEAHFGQVMDNFLLYLKNKQLPSWEVPNMLAKYYLTTAALDMAKKKDK